MIAWALLTITLDPRSFRKDCGFTNNMDYYYQSNGYNRLNNTPIPVNIAIISSMFSAMWDFVPLLLYIYKIRSFRIISSNHSVYERIMELLSKVLILTITYEVFWVIGGAVAMIIQSLWNDVDCAHLVAGILTPPMFSYSVYLMMDRNEEECQKFLRIIYKFGLHWICCKWKYLVDKSRKKNIDSTVNQTGSKEEVAEITYQTEDLSTPKSHHIPQISIPTLVECEPLQ